MSSHKVFNKSVQGASHIASGKPCQDFSALYDEGDVQIVVVCDGHGGSTYFRSDVGARIASEAVIECLKNFAICETKDTFRGKSFSITAKPKRNPFIDADGNRVRYEDLDDTQKQYARQARSYVESEGKFTDEQAVVSELLSQIYTVWQSNIEADLARNPFNKKELEILKGQDISKAYGCTLLAYLKTPYYWLAFQIGDGRIYVCDKNLVWTKPVPEDCSCFLNYTTSLCDSNPLSEFRYAFNGEEDFPLAVMVCSDGVEGSLRTDSNLQDFYEQVIGLVLDGDNVDEELESYLPQLSESGNRDDMSLAGIVDLSGIQESDIRKKMSLKTRERSIHNEYRTKKNEIDNLNGKIESLNVKLDRQKDSRFMLQSELDDIRKDIQAKESKYAEIENLINSLKSEIEELKRTVAEKQKSLDDWKFTIKNEMAELESNQGGMENNNIQDYTNW